MMCRGSVAGIHLRPAGCSAPPGPQPADQDQPQAIQGLSRHVRAVPHEGDKWNEQFCDLSIQIHWVRIQAFLNPGPNILISVEAGMFFAYYFLKVHCSDRIGLLDKPPASSAFLPLRASSRTRFPTLLTPQHRNMSVVIHNLYCVWGSDQGETSHRNLKG